MKRSSFFVLVVWVSLAISGISQDAAPKLKLTEPDGPTKAKIAEPDSPPKVEEGTLLDVGKKPVPNANVNFKGPDGANQIEKVTTDQAGKFKTGLRAGKYDVSIDSNGQSVSGIQVTKELAKPIGDIILPTYSSPIIPVWYWAAALFFYYFVALFARRFNITSVTRTALQAEVDVTEQQVETITEAGAKTRATELIKESKDLISSLNPFAQEFLSFLFGMRGHEISIWSRLGEVERILAGGWTKKHIISRLLVLAEQLRPEYSVRADNINAILLNLKSADTTTVPSTEYLRSTLIEALSCAQEKNEDAIISRLNWQNKAFALIFLGACLLSLMAFQLPNPILLLVGFAGGFASRLLRGGGSASVTTGADLHWTTLFLSPIYGAFTGWAGILLLTILKDLRVVGDIPGLQWDNASSMVLGIAFLFGFVERMFSAVTDLAEKAVVKERNASAVDPPPTQNPPQRAVDVAVKKDTEAKMEATWKGRELTLRGKNLSSFKGVKLKPSTGDDVSLELVPAVAGNQDLVARLLAGAPDLPTGTYEVLLDGKPSGTSVKVP